MVTFPGMIRVFPASSTMLRSRSRKEMHRLRLAALQMHALKSPQRPNWRATHSLVSNIKLHNFIARDPARIGDIHRYHHGIFRRPRPRLSFTSL